MKLKVLTAMLAAAVLMAPAALAAPSKSKPPKLGPGCRPSVAVVLKGTLTAAPGANATSLSMKVTRGNRAGKVLVGQTVTIKIGVKTKITMYGNRVTTADLQAKDRLVVKLHVCKANLPLTVAFIATVAAQHIVASPPPKPL